MQLVDILTLGDQTDEHGRLLLEDSAAKVARKNAARLGVAMKSVSCPYKDTPSRYGARMNVSAYEALRRDTARILDGFAWLGQRYETVARSPRATAAGLAKVSKLGVSLPLVLFHRGTDAVPPHRALASYVAAIFKAGRGIFSAAVDMMNKQDPEAPATAAGVVQFAEAESHLVRRQTGRACAAPTRLIERTIDAALTGRGADADRSGLAELIEFDQLWRFCELEDSLSDACSAYKFVFDNLVRNAKFRHVDGELFDRVVRYEGREITFGALTQELLQRADAVQSGLNRLLGRRDDVRPAAVEDLLRIL